MEEGNTSNAPARSSSDVARRSIVGTAALRAVASLLTTNKALWGVCRDVDELTSRTLVLNADMPLDIQQRMVSMLEQQQEREEPKHDSPSPSEAVVEGIREGLQRLGRVGEPHADWREDSGLNGKMRSFRVTAVRLGLKRRTDVTLASADEALMRKVLALLPKSVKRVLFFDSVDHPNVLLPSSVEEVIFGYRFNQTVTFPLSVKKIVFGESFDQTVILPSSLEEVVFGPWYNRATHFPSSVKKITFGDSFDQPEALLPSSLEEVVFGLRFQQRVVFPPSVKKIVFGAFFQQPNVILPSSLEEVVLGSNYNMPIAFPASVKKITFGWSFNQSGVRLPSALEEVKFDSCFNRPIVFPPSVKKIEMGGCFDQQLDLPPGLQELRFSSDGFQQPLFNHPLDLPASLRILRLGRNYTCPLANLPAGLRKLTVGEGCPLPQICPRGSRGPTFSLVPRPPRDCEYSENSDLANKEQSSSGGVQEQEEEQEEEQGERLTNTR